MKAIDRCTYCGVYAGEEHINSCPIVLQQRLVDPVPEGLSRTRAAQLLHHAAELINGERAKDYGEPQQSFENIAQLWSTYLHQEITVTDVGMMMILLKVSRNGRHRNKADNFVDICGYAALVGSESFKNEGK